MATADMELRMPGELMSNVSLIILVSLVRLLVNCSRGSPKDRLQVICHFKPMVQGRKLVGGCFAGPKYKVFL